tara:strand:- start:940 stop:2607 length:1668 start_codon:yes stop_codon:yes gene_type:complete
MAKIKIERSNRQIAQLQNIPVGAAALPTLQIGAMVEQGFNALTKPILDAAKLTKKQEDKNSLRKLKLETYSKISEALGKYNNETKIENLTTFIKDLDPKNFENLIKDQNKDVKQAFNNYLADTVDKNYDNLYSKIISNHTEQSYANDLDDVMSFDKMEASDDIKTRLYGAGQKSLFFNDPSNEARYGAKAWKKLKEDSKKRTLTFQLAFRTKNDPFGVYELGSELEELVGTEEAKIVRSNAANAIVSNYVDERNFDEIKEKADTRAKVSNFAYMLNNNQTFTVDDINDMFKSDQLNSSQRNALYRVKLGEIEPSDENILTLINGAIHSAEGIEDLDAIESAVLTSPELADKLGIKDLEKFIQVFDKYKSDRPGFINYKKNRKLLADDLRKVEEGQKAMLQIGPNLSIQQTEKRTEILGLDYYDTLIKNGYSAEDAYVEVAEKYLDTNNLPDIYSIAVTKSVKLDPPTNDELKAGKLTGQSYFKKYRDEAANVFNQTKDLKTYTEDMDALDVIEDMFYVRKQQFEGLGNDGVASAFAETNPSVTANKIKVETPPGE